MLDSTLILSVFVVASCGLAYELITAALASYLLGDSILQFSTIIGCYLFAMGIGSHLAQYVPEDKVLDRFIEIELLVGLIGGLSATVLFVIFAWLSMPFRTVLYALVLIIGMLVGMEIPLVMRVLNQHKAEFSALISRVLTFDYLGALAVSLLFPLILAPKLGLARSALLFGISNAAVAAWTIYKFKHQLQSVSRQRNRAILSLGFLMLAFVGSDKLVSWSEQQIFADPIIHAQSTPYQRLIVTRWQDDLRLYINGNLQFSSRDEYRYHEALVHPALATQPQAKTVLVLGGGDGLAVREILRYPHIENVTLVDLDPAMTSLFSTNAELTKLNHNSLLSTKVTVVNADAGHWLEQQQQPFDVIIADFPDPSNFGLGKLYSVPMYRLVKQHLKPNGLFVVQSTSPFFAKQSFWCINQTLKEAGFFTYPYHVLVPSFGEWGYVLADLTGNYQPPQHYQLPMQFLDMASTALMFQFPPDMQPVKVEANRLNNQMLVHYFEQDWSRVIR